MIDLHTHILPDMDDGSKSVEESEQMLLELKQQGVTTIVATPHFYADREAPREFLLRRKRSFEQLKNAEILLGAEVAYFSGISRCEEITLLCIEGTRLLLLELPFDAWNRTMLDEVCSMNKRLGIITVIAHINRYRSLPNFAEAVERMLQCGIKMQCNAEPISSIWSGRRLLRMIRSGMIHFIGSDCHNMTRRPPNIAKAMARMEKKLDVRSFCENARNLLKGAVHEER